MSLDPRFVFGSLDLTEYPFGVEFGSNLGKPENAVELMTALLADGEIVTATRKSNRLLTIPVMLEGPDLAALDESEALLVAECDRRMNTLSVDPGDGYAQTRAFDTFTAELERVYDDDGEQAAIRRFVLTIPALPFRRGTTLIVDNAGTPPSSGGTLLNDCESTTGWSAWLWSGAWSVDSVIFAEGAGSIKATSYEGYSEYSGGIFGKSNYDQLSGVSYSTSTGGYMSVRVRLEYPDLPSGFTRNGLLTVKMTTAGGVIDASAAIVASSRDAEGFVRYVWPVDAGLTVTALSFGVVQYLDGFTTTTHVWYDDIRLLTAATTDHQIVKQLTVEGSARTTGSLHVAAPSDIVPLGHVLAITAPTSEIPAGFQPDGARWVTQGTTTVDATAIEGIYYTPDLTTYSSAAGKPIFDVPVAMLTAGPYMMVALVKAESPTLTFGVQAQLNVDGTMVGPPSAAEVSPTGLTTGWQFIPVGTVYLPPLPVQSADATTKVRLLFKGAKMANVYMIPAWQVGGRAVADFSIVDCGDGTVEPGGASSSLWIDSPSTSQPQGGWWRGPTTDRVNTQSAWPDAKKPGIHTFNPGSLSAFLVSTEAAGPTLTLEYFDRWI